MSKQRMCILCGKGPAEVPDRERLGKPIKRVCVECHGERLWRDFARIMEAHSRHSAPDPRSEEEPHDPN